MKINTIIVLIILLVVLTTSSCEIGRVSQTQLQLERYSLKKADLPNGWSFDGESWDVEFGGESYAISYLRDNHVFVTHTISIHASEERAQQAHKKWETEWFDLTNLQPGVSFSPSDQDDDYRYQCRELQPNHPIMFCVYLQRHNNVISFVKVNLDNQSKFNLTFEEINDILGILDERLNEVVIDVNSEGVTP